MYDGIEEKTAEQQLVAKNTFLKLFTSDYNNFLSWAGVNINKAQDFLFQMELRYNFRIDSKSVYSLRSAYRGTDYDLSNQCCRS